MGAHTFITRASGKTVAEAFNKAVEDAQYQYGHAGYTGTIAEKRSWRMVYKDDSMGAMEFAEAALNAEPDSEGTAAEVAAAIIDDKWGPCACVAEGVGQFVFFGWASS
jgi:hypothetical protein